ncbi:MAG: phosphoheptose isomerase [Bacteroidetes bacterium]|nr:MAG: phosphoheptose isomerase [Bacteroidota bacterium]
MKTSINASLEEARRVLDDFMSDAAKIEAIEGAAQLMLASIRKGGKIISCGNGGSMTDAMHFAEELSGVFRHKRPALPALSISDPSHLSCVANDCGFETVFSRYVEGLGMSGDLLLAISTSGNSPNILNAATAAREKGMKVVALTGKDGGKLASMSDVEIRVSGGRYSDRIQELHIKVLHILVQLIEEQLHLS